MKLGVVEREYLQEKEAVKKEFEVRERDGSKLQ